MAESKWAEFVHQKALKYLRSKAAEWEDSSRKMESLGKLDKGIAGVTLGIIGAGTMAGAYIEYGGVAVLKILAKGFVGSTVAGG